MINDSSSGTSSHQDPSSLKLNVPNISEKPNQPPNSFNFPTRKFGKTNVLGRKFQSKWFILYPWLHYDETNDQVFCNTCIQAYNQGHLNSCNNMEATFMKKGYSNWKDALSNNCGFKLHESSSCHHVSVETAYTLPRTTNDVADLLSKKHAAEKEVAKKALLKILSNVWFLARQALPF